MRICIEVKRRGAVSNCVRTMNPAEIQVQTFLTLVCRTGALLGLSDLSPFLCPTEAACRTPLHHIYLATLVWSQA